MERFYFYLVRGGASIYGFYIYEIVASCGFYIYEIVASCGFYIYMVETVANCGFYIYVICECINF